MMIPQSKELNRFRRWEGDEEIALLHASSGLHPQELLDRSIFPDLGFGCSISLCRIEPKTSRSCYCRSDLTMTAIQAALLAAQFGVFFAFQDRTNSCFSPEIVALIIGFFVFISYQYRKTMNDIKNSHWTAKLLPEMLTNVAILLGLVHELFVAELFLAVSANALVLATTAGKISLLQLQSKDHILIENRFVDTSSN
jgi:hypothetical protein